MEIFPEKTSLRNLVPRKFFLPSPPNSAPGLRHWRWSARHGKLIMWWNNNNTWWKQYCLSGSWIDEKSQCKWKLDWCQNNSVIIVIYAIFYWINWIDWFIDSNQKNFFRGVFGRGVLLCPKSGICPGVFALHSWTDFEKIIGNFDRKLKMSTSQQLAFASANPLYFAIVSLHKPELKFYNIFNSGLCKNKRAVGEVEPLLLLLAYFNSFSFLESMAPRRLWLVFTASGAWY